MKALALFVTLWLVPWVFVAIAGIAFWGETEPREKGHWEEWRTISSSDTEPKPVKGTEVTTSEELLDKFNAEDHRNASVTTAPKIARS